MKEYLQGEHSVYLIQGHWLYPELEILYQPYAEPYTYAEDYWQAYQSRKGTDIEQRLNDHRCSMVRHSKCLIDVGIGNGSFLSNFRGKGYGFDINPHAVTWLNNLGIFLDPYQGVPKEVDTFTFWDCLEHFANPSDILDVIPFGCKVAASLPIFSNLHSVTESKHYKPNGEHRWYATCKGFVDYMSYKGFDCLDVSSGETKCGRESIKSFLFIRTSNNGLSD